MSKQETYNRIARLYDLLDLPFEHLRYWPVRQALFNGLKGTLLDAGVGTGRNFPHYPEEAKVRSTSPDPVWGDPLGVSEKLAPLNIFVKCRKSLFKP